MKAAIDGWTPERVKRAEAMWTEGASATEIAVALACGLSRNAILGAAWRRRWGRSIGAPKPSTARRSGSAASARPKAQRTPREAPGPTIRPFRRDAEPELQPTVPLVSADEPAGENATAIFDLRPLQCRWPLWGHGAAPGLFCGEATASYEESYCPLHRAKAGGGFPQRRSPVRRAPLMIAAE